MAAGAPRLDLRMQRERGARPLNKVPVTASATTVTVPASSVKNGRLAYFGEGGNTIGPSTETAPAQTASQVGCPSDNWTTSPSATFFQTIDLQVQQGGTTVLDCTASNPNGITGTVTLNRR